MWIFGVTDGCVGYDLRQVLGTPNDPSPFLLVRIELVPCCRSSFSHWPALRPAGDVAWNSQTMPGSAGLASEAYSSPNQGRNICNKAPEAHLERPISTADRDMAPGFVIAEHAGFCRSCFLLVLLLPGLCGFFLPHLAAAADIETIGHGERVDLAANLVEGKYVLFDFYADWCPGCTQIEPMIARLAAENPQLLAVRKIDIVNWQSAVASQYRLRSIPHLRLFDPDGKLVASGDPGQVLATLDRSLGNQGLVGEQQSQQSSALVPLVALLAAALLAAYLLLGKSKRENQPPIADRSSPSAPFEEQAADSRTSSLWLIRNQDGIDGPFSLDHIFDLRRKSLIGDETRARRKGETQWHPLDELTG